MRINNDDAYIKVSYKTPPIGPDKIVLELWTFDKERYERDQEIEKHKHEVEIINPLRTDFYDIKSNVDRFIGYNSFAMPTPPRLTENMGFYELENSLINYVDMYYRPYVEELKRVIDTYKNMIDNAPKDIPYIRNGDITNADIVECDVIQGDVINCKEVHCKEIKGDTINCKIYKD